MNYPNSVPLRNLYEKAPEAAQLLATTILECSDPNNYPQDIIEGPQPRLNNNNTQATKRKSVSNKNLSYRTPKITKAKAEIINSLAKSGQPEDGSNFYTDGLTQGYISDRVQSFIQDEENTTI